MIAFILALMILAERPAFSNIEEPNYEVIQSEQDKNIEMRRYAPIIIAEVEVEGDRRDAINKGFRQLADYIFGNNTAQQQKSQKIAMTAPVQQQSAISSPFGTVSADTSSGTSSGISSGISSGTLWRVSFVMPSQYNMETIAKPNNSRITLKEIPAKTFVVIQFSGTSSDKNIAKHEKKLMQYISSNQIKTTGTPKYAFYDSPWTLPIMRRNEIMVEISDQRNDQTSNQTSDQTSDQTNKQ